MIYNGITIPGSDSSFCYLATPIPSTTTKSFKSSIRIRTPPSSRFSPLRVNAVSVAEPSSWSSSSSSGLSFYQLLGIPESGSLPDIKNAYKQLARKYHPDVSPPGRVEEYTQMFIRVHEAYETLSDPGRRAMYDRDMARGLHLAFSARRRYYDDEMIDQKNKWRARWETQLAELKYRNNYKYGDRSESWAARMRRKRNESLNEVYC